MRRDTTPVLADLTSRSAALLERVSLSERTVNEGWLQALLFDCPTLLPVDELSLDAGPLIPIGREVGVKVGRIDCLYVSPSGQLTVVEVKLWSNPEARRQVVAQIIDYAKELSRWGYEDLDQCARGAAGRSLWELVEAEATAVGLTESDFVDEVTRNLRRGDFLLLLVGDGIREEVERMAEFLQGTPQLHFTLALIEMHLYRFPGSESLLVVPSVVAQTKEVVRAVVRVEQVGNGYSNVDVTMAEPTVREDRGGGQSLDEADFLKRSEADARNDHHARANLQRLLGLCRDDPRLDAHFGAASFKVTLNLGGPKASLPSALTVFTTGVLKFHDGSFRKNILRRVVSEEAGLSIFQGHLDGLKAIAGEDITWAVLNGGKGPHIGSLPGGIDALLELLTTTARSAERELGID